MTVGSNLSLSPEARSDGTNPRPSRNGSHQHRAKPIYNEKTSAYRGGDTSHPSPPKILATNFQTVKYRMPISGTYVVDPSLEMPADLVVDNPTKKANLSLECGRGSVTAHIWLVDDATPMRGIRRKDVGRAVIDVHCNSWLGKVNVKLFSLTEHPFSLSASSNGGDINIALPSDFVGPITLSTGSLYDTLRPSSFTPFAPSGIRETKSKASDHTEVRTVPYSTSINFSDAVQSRLVTFSEVGGTRTCFIGDYRTSGYTSRKEWSGSLVDIKSSLGSLKVGFVDEPQGVEQVSGCTVM